METSPETLIEESTSCASKQKASSFSDQRISSTGGANENVELAFAVFADIFLGERLHWWLMGIVQDCSPRGMSNCRLHNIKEA
jgi:hypothetical protein